MSWAHKMLKIPLKICNLSSAEKNLLIHLSAYADFDTGKDTRDAGKNIRPTWNTMMDITGFSRSNLSKLLKSLVEKKILLKSVDNSARHNPHTHSRKPCVYQLNIFLLNEWISRSSNTQTLEPITSSPSELALVLPENQTSSPGEPHLCNTYSSTYEEGNLPPKSISSKEKTAKQPSQQVEQGPAFSLPNQLFSFEDFKTIAREMEIHPSNDKEQYDKLCAKKGSEKKTKSAWEQYVRKCWLDRGKENLRQPNPKQLRPIRTEHLDFEGDSEQERDQKREKREAVYWWCKGNPDTHFVKVTIEERGGIEECRKSGFPKYDDFIDGRIV